MFKSQDTFDTLNKIFKPCFFSGSNSLLETDCQILQTLIPPLHFWKKFLEIGDGYKE